LWTLDKNSLRSLCMWTHKNQIIFCMIVALLRLTKLSTFEALSKQFCHHHCLTPPKIGRRGHTFHLDPSLLNLEVCNSAFKCLKLPTWSVKTIKTKVQVDEQHVIYLIFIKSESCLSKLVIRVTSFFMDSNSFLIMWLQISSLFVLHFFS
jgi:hypothetical protein